MAERLLFTTHSDQQLDVHDTLPDQTVTTVVSGGAP